ncbi:MAG: hypothetical protein Q4C53_07660 [Clostridia bacterium]|nr:hypothetical protein [Clostridia bacterium]
MRKSKKQLLAENDEMRVRIERLEECIKTQDRLIEGYQKREHAVVAALETVENSIVHRLGDADAKARKITCDAEQYALQLRHDAEAKAAEVSERISQYNAALERACAEAARNAEFFLGFAKDKALPLLDPKIAAGGISSLLEPVADLPDAEDDPKKLMQNIYRLQHRDLPECEREEPANASAPAPEPDDGPLAPTVSELLGRFRNEETQVLPECDLPENKIIQSGDK